MQRQHFTGTRPRGHQHWRASGSDVGDFGPGMRHHDGPHGFGPDHRGHGHPHRGPRDDPRESFGPDPREAFEAFGPRGRGGFGPDPRRGRRGMRARRGDIRSAILLLLAEEPMHGYQLIQQIAEHTEGSWKPSPGTIYPALSLLEDEGLITIETGEGRKLATLTDAGTTYVQENAENLAKVWDNAEAREQSAPFRLREGVGQLAEAARLAAHQANEEQVTVIIAELDSARRKIYAILAQEPTE